MAAPEILTAEQLAERLRGRAVVDVEIVEDGARRAIVLQVMYPGRTGAHALLGPETFSILAGYSGDHEEPELVFFAGRVVQWGDVEL